MERIVNNAPQTFGKFTELSLYTLLRQHGRKVKRTTHNHPYDLLVDSKWRCEVKAAHMFHRKHYGEWMFNFHRHGKLNEPDVDLYILCFKGVPEHKKALYLVKRAPVGVQTLQFSLRSLISTAAPMIEDFDRLITGVLA